MFTRLRKPAGHGSNPPSGRLRLAILAATVAAFLLVPVAQAAALGTLKVNITGTGSGEVKSEWGFTNIGTPALACSYASPGPAAGSPIPCKNEMAELEPGVGIVNLLSTPAPGSVVASVIVNEGVDFTPEALGVGCNDAAGQEALQALLEEALGVSGWVCLVGGGGNAEVTVTFDLIEFPLTVTKTGAGTGTVQCDTGSGPEACKAEYPEGTEVTLAATAAPGSTFAGFSAGTGSAAGCSTSPCAFTIEADSAVTATFNANPPEPKTCATDPSLCPKETPLPTPEGKAKASPAAPVKGGKAALKLTCSGGPCKGTLQLTAKLKQGKKTKNAVIGKASFSLADGASTTLKVKLSSQAKQLLKSGKALKAKVTGSGIEPGTVKLK
jgi:hypothetical protein